MQQGEGGSTSVFFVAVAVEATHVSYGQISQWGIYASMSEWGIIEENEITSSFCVFPSIRQMPQRPIFLVSVVAVEATDVSPDKIAHGGNYVLRSWWDIWKINAINRAACVFLASVRLRQIP